MRKRRRGGGTREKQVEEGSGIFFLSPIKYGSILVDI